jgi:RNA polymerase sigma-70 factor (ECF subfamily)
MNEPMLSELFVEQYNALLGVAFQLTKDEDDALDMVQDLAEAIARIDQPLHLFQNPMAYFRTRLRNARISELRKAGREVPSEPELIDNNPAKEDVEKTIEFNELIVWLKSEMMDYSPEMQEAFRMYFFDGYSLEEVADKLGVSKNTLSQRFTRIRTRLTDRALKQSLIMLLLLLYILNSR